MSRYIAHLIGHPARIVLSCGCTRVLSVSPEWLLGLLGADATIEDGERRLRCKACGQRTALRPEGEYGVTGGRDRRVNPPAMPGWVNLK